MPCRDFMDSNDVSNLQSVVHQLRGETDSLAKRIQKGTEENAYLSACLCAILNELETAGVANDVIKKASQNGRIDIHTFWEEHTEQDKNRLLKDLSKYSEHERQLLKKLLNE